MHTIRNSELRKIEISGCQDAVKGMTQKMCSYDLHIDLVIRLLCIDSCSICNHQQAGWASAATRDPRKPTSLHRPWKVERKRIPIGWTNLVPEVS
ncbi:hypothetical protein E2C01_093246 [Portunus trituberculatus]|uniref:Uncharacterized protein n=1 Tax=Portunus trituberculatus TaxID=210409 RepID=A0A5B7JTZ5_PORTR|nr:hypothetical protein [Portunus trituberculatus]